MKKIRLALVGFVSATLVAGFVGSAHADPDAVAAARAELDRIQQEASLLDSEIIEAILRANEAEEKLVQVRGDLEEQESEVGRMADDLASIAMIQFQSGGFDITAQLLTSDSDESFLSGLATIQNEMDRSNSDLQALQLGQAKVEDLRDEAERTATALAEERATKEALAKEYDEKEAEAQRVYDRLDAEEQERLRRIEEERQRQADEADRRAREAAEAASRSASGQTALAAPAPAAVSGDASSRAMQAVTAARAQVGKRYVWGTSGPNTFDCSGLTSYAYRQAGLNITRSSRGQAGLGVKVSKSNLQPGDLVFYYSPISHVGIYIGNGQIVDAANPRRGVRIASVNSMPFNTARRIA